MFGNRRRRAASNPPLNGTNANANATTAAAQAFLKNRSSNASLSSAAAAAALRSRPTTPTSVADVQTKRTLRRAGSVSSMSSSVAGSIRERPGSQLERRPSNGSMTERTFRDPSPARTQAVPSAPDAPPVPAIPKGIQQSQPPIPAKSHRRAASMEAPPMRVASPPPNKPNGRGSSLGPGASPQSPRRTNPRNTGLSSAQETTSIERPASRGQNPPKIVSPTNQNLIYDPNTRSFRPEAELLAYEQSLYDAANRPVKKKKKPVSAAGTHLSNGGMGAQPRGTAIDAMEAAAASNPAPIQQPIQAVAAPIVLAAPVQTLPPPAPEPPEAAAPPRRKKKRVVVSDSEEEGSYAPGSSDTDSDVPQTYTTRPGGKLAKKPSIVREDREREEREDDTPGKTKASDGLKIQTSPASERQISPSPLPRSAAGRGHGRGQARASAAFAQGRQNGRSASQPPLSPNDSPTDGVGLVSRDSVRGGRVQSVSPARTAHFATVQDSLSVKHNPPARSISPRKSALKHSNSPRGMSPSGDHGSELGGSEASSFIIGSDELVVPQKKKVNRVSFDETNVVVGQAATPVTTDSPVVASPQTKRPWYSIGRGKKKETVLSDDDDEVMKPRPALPSFGSVRERKVSKEAGERALVKPTEVAEEKLAPASPPLFTTPTGEVIEFPLGQSRDHAVGAVLAQDASSKNEANTSKSREPLPPEVTSVEGTGYHSDTDSSVYSTDNKGSDIRVARSNSVKRGPEDGHADTYRALANSEDADTEEHTNGKAVSDELDDEEEDLPTPKATDIVPEIAVVEATPTLDESESKTGWPDMPGSWGSTDDSDSATETTVPPIAPTPAVVGVAEPSPVVHAPISPQTPVVIQAAYATPAIMEEPESDADTSVYSDAAEELTDTEGDGFMSLNAVVESPASKIINTNIPGLAISTPPDSPITRLTKENAYKNNQLSRADGEPEMNAGWDKIQEYWSTLSAEKKRQLEIEARDESEESDSTIEPTPAPRQKKKKVVVQDTPKAQPAQSERSYMIQPGAKAGPNGHAHMRSSMRGEAPNTTEEPHIRKTMRGSGSMRSSETIESRGSLQKKNRPVSQPGEIKADPVAVRNHVRALSAASASVAAKSSAIPAVPAAPQRDMKLSKPSLRRKGSGDSDSSFKRARSHSNAEIPSFKRSMRSSMDQEPAGRNSSPMRSSRFSLRSLSPTGSTFRRPFNPAPTNPAPTMRGSMRKNARDGPTMRNNSSKGFARGSAAKPSKQKARPNKSRFADSSDEEEDRPAFRSRFNDSSDEDEPMPMPIPRTMRSNGFSKTAGGHSRDSSDLLETDEEKPSASVIALSKKISQNGTTAPPVSSQGAALASGSLRRSGSGRGTISSPIASTPIRPSHSRRGSFMSILRRKTADPTSKVRKSDAESPARRDTPLERSKSELQNLREQTASPKLQKRNTVSRQNSGAWPLPVPTSPPKILGDDDKRPFSADNGMGVTGASASNDINGNGTADRPDLGNRRFTATGLADVDLSPGGVLGEGRKKKKFGKLRRMFRLDE